jgi:hypothetical protein
MRLSPLALLAPLVACSSPPAPGTFAVREARLLDTIPAGTNVVLPAAWSRDGQRVAYVARTRQGDFAVCGDWTGKEYAVI